MACNQRSKAMYHPYMATTLILGGGFGGIATANALRRALGKEHRIVVIDKSPTFRIGATKTWVATGLADADSMDFPLDALTARGIEFQRKRIAKIDTSQRQVVLEDGTALTGDFLVIALGADVSMAGIPGMEAAAETFYTIEGARRMAPTLRSFEKGRIVLLVCRTPFKCPPGPYEAVMMFHDLLKHRGVLEHCQLDLWTPEGAPMATAGPEIGQFVKSLLAERSIGFHPQKKVVSVDPATKTIVFEDSSTTFDLLIAVPPHSAPQVVKEANLTGQSGWIHVDPKTLAVPGYQDVFAIGDVTTVPLPGRFKPDVGLVLPKAGVAAAAQGRVVASNIAATVLGKGPSAVFDGKIFCYMETGDMHAFKASGDFFATPNPQMVSVLPDMQQFEDKKSWARGWVAEELGL